MFFDSRLRFLTWMVLGAVVPSPSSKAAVRQVADGVIRIACSDADDSKHPKRLVLEHLVQMQGLEPGTAFLVFYDSSQEGEPQPGRVRVEVSRFDEKGKAARLEKLGAKSDPETGEAELEAVAAVSVERGDLLRWGFKFSKFRALRSGKCFSVQAIVTPAE